MRRRRTIWVLWAVALVLSALAMGYGPPSGAQAAEPVAAAVAVEEPTGYLALTFDDGPFPQTTEALLDGLAARGVHATFFLIGSQVAGMEDVVERMAEEGHQVGIHTWDHIQLHGLPTAALCAQLGQTRACLQSILGPVDLMVRPPYGFVDDALRACAGGPIVCWSVDTEDWRTKDSGKILDVIYRCTGDGDIVLLHDRYQNTVDAVLMAIEHLQQQGYVFVTVAELLEIKGIKASVVMTEYHGLIYLSARSIDEVNVQVMMEKLGGGGHRTIAGAQLSGISMDEAKDRVKAVIDEMLQKGDIS